MARFFQPSPVLQASQPELRVSVTPLPAAWPPGPAPLFEPEQVPGLIYRMGEPKVVMLLFASGKLVCTGAKHEDMVREAVEQLDDLLEDYALIYYD